MTEKKENSPRIGIASIAVPCSSRKEKLPASFLLGANLPRAAQGRIADEWVARLKRAHARLTPAKDLYLGVSFRRARRVAQRSSAPLFILSAGLGLISGDAVVPSSDLTLSPAAPEHLRRPVRET